MNLQPIFLELALTTRKNEQEKWEEYLQKLKQGQSSKVIVLAKENDVGQNNWMRALLSQQNISCYYGKCQSSNQTLFGPYHAFHQAFPDFFQQCSEQMKQQFLNIGKSLSASKYQGFGSKSNRANTQIAVDGLDFEQPHFLAASFVQFLSQLPTPYIIYLEDIHNADLATLEMWKFLSTGLSNKPILLVATGTRDTSEAPDLPAHLRGNNIPVLQQLKALQFTAKPKTFAKQERQTLLELYRESPIIELSKVPWTEIISLLKGIFSPNVSEIFLEMLGQQSQHHPFYLGQILAYLSDVLTSEGELLALKFSESDIDIPRDLEEIFLSNLGKLSTSTIKALEYAALFPIPMPKELWQKCCDYPEDVWQKIIRESQDEGVLQSSPDNEKLVFSHEKLRQALLKQISNPRQKTINFTWAEIAKEVNLPNYLRYYFSQKGPEPQTGLYDLFDAGLYAESLLSPLSACEFYKEGSKSFPEIREAFEQELKNILAVAYPQSSAKNDKKKQENTNQEENNPEEPSSTNQEEKDIKKRGFFDWLEKKFTGFDSQEKNDLIQKFLEVMRLYRLANFEGQPVFTEQLQYFIKRMLYWQSPAKFLPTFWTLLRYLVNVSITMDRSYPKEDILVLWNLVAEHLVPKKDFNTQKLLRQNAQRCQLNMNYANQDLAQYLAMSKQTNDILKKLEYNLNAGFLARQSKDFFKALEILFRNIQLSAKYLQTSDVPYWEAESLRHLGLVYEQWARDIYNPPEIETVVEQAKTSGMGFKKKDLKKDDFEKEDSAQENNISEEEDTNAKKTGRRTGAKKAAAKKVGAKKRNSRQEDPVEIEPQEEISPMKKVGIKQAFAQQSFSPQIAAPLIKQPRQFHTKEEEQSFIMAAEKAQKAAFAYSDASNCQTRLQEINWLANILLKKSLHLAKLYEFDTNEFESSLKTIATKYDLTKDQQEYHRGRGIIVCDNIDLGSADLLEQVLRQEDIEPNISISPDILDLNQWSKDYTKSILLVNSYSKIWEYEYPRFLAQSAACEGNRETMDCGWFVSETSHHTRIVFIAPTPGQLYRLVRQCTKEKTLAKYL